MPRNTQLCLIRHTPHNAFHTRNTYRINGFSVNAVDAARRMGRKEHSVDRIESPQWRYICCAGKSAVAHKSEPTVKKQDSSRKNAKRRPLAKTVSLVKDSSHPKTFAVKCFGPIAYPIGGSRYHRPTELTESTTELTEMTANPLAPKLSRLTGLDSIGDRESKTEGDVTIVLN